MRVILVNPRGFCAGVRMAIDVVDQVLDVFRDRRIYVYHEIVHNKHVVGRFRDRGVTFVEDVDEIPPGEVVVFSAHGISPEVRRRAEARRLTAIDATCPLVTKVHSEAVRYARQGFQILLIGHRNHQEVVGTFGEAPEAIQVVESPDDIARLSIRDPERLVYLTQTTLSTDDAGVIIQALRKAFPKIRSPPSEDICYATTNRQHAVRTLAPMCDLVLVVGSQNSSNSKRLTEIAENAGTRAQLLDDVGDLDPAWFEGVHNVLLSAGASAPEDLVAGICRELVTRFNATLALGDVVEEKVDFALPGTLRKEMRRRGINPEDRRIHVEPPQIIEAVYGGTAVPLTIEGKTSEKR
ncbi:MAG: 4-hydroxy-3-methylbut-2-enyl diphosphate reductase [Phycisphaerales bacterium]|nr:4-hydroxy-3-methylbut-2-enyl diphosphate reductase [Phycisphaerales bacterium]